MNRKTMLSILTALIISISMVGCGNNGSSNSSGQSEGTIQEEQTTEPILEQGPVMLIEDLISDGGPYYTVIQEIKNNDPKLGFIDGTYNIALYDETGALVAADDRTLGYMLPGQRRYLLWDLMSTRGKRAVTAEINIKIPKWQDMAMYQIPEMTIEDFSFSGDYLYGYFLGILVNNSEKTVPNEQMEIVGYNEAGVPVVAGLHLFENVEPNSRNPFEFMSDSYGQEAAPPVTRWDYTLHPNKVDGLIRN